MASTQQDLTTDRAQIAVRQARERFWQVLFPVIFASLLVVGFLIYLIIASRGSGAPLEQLGGVASIILILPALLGLFIVLAVFVALIYLFAKLTGVIPSLAQQVIAGFGQAKAEIQKVADGSVEPIMKLSEISAKVHQVFNSLQKRLK